MESEEVMTDRRNDIGMKVLVGMMSSVILLFVGAFIHTAWATAYDGKKKADEVSERMAIMETKMTGFASDVSEMKNDVKQILRRMPT